MEGLSRIDVSYHQGSADMKKIYEYRFGKPVITLMVELDIDIERLAKMLAKKAWANKKTRKSRLHDGIIIVRVYEAW